MGRVRFRRITGRATVRGIVALLCAACLAAFALAGLVTGAQARAEARSGQAAELAIAPAKPAGCFQHGNDCTSSDPEAKFYLVSSGDTSGCKFDVTVKWDDGGGPIKEPPINGGLNGTKFGPYSHDYKKPGSYQISWTSTLVSNTGFNDCQSSSAGFHFTLITAGIYADFQSPSLVQQAVDAGWTMIANVGGVGAPAGCKSPWTKPANNDSDSSVEQVLAATKNPPAWISYWTPEIPPTGASLSAAGRAAGQEAAADIEAAAVAVAGRAETPAAPLYVALDFEESTATGGVKSCGKNVPKKDLNDKKPPKGEWKQCWQWLDAASARNCFQLNLSDWLDFAKGWAAGVESAKSPVALTPAVYVTQAQYAGSGLKKYGYPEYGIGTWGMPVIVAVAPVRPAKAPVTGPGIVGYAAFGNVSQPAACSTAPADVKNVVKWSGVSTIQFGHVVPGRPPKYKNSDYCTPAGGTIKLS